MQDGYPAGYVHEIPFHSSSTKHLTNCFPKRLCIPSLSDLQRPLTTSAAINIFPAPSTRPSNYLHPSTPAPARDLHTGVPCHCLCRRARLDPAHGNPSPEFPPSPGNVVDSLCPEYSLPRGCGLGYHSRATKGLGEDGGRSSCLGPGVEHCLVEGV